jgi:hypothetical protein
MALCGREAARLLTNLVFLRIPEEHALDENRHGSGKYRGLFRVRRGMPWPARLPYMPLEVMSILHLLTCISTRTGRCCFTLFYSFFTPALLLLYI